MTTDQQMWDVLADHSRRAIIGELAGQARAVGELAEVLPISRPAVSQHLRVLKDAGLVSDEVHGTRRVYRVEPAALRTARGTLEQFWSGVLVEAPSPEPAKDRKKKHKKKGKH